MKKIDFKEINLIFILAFREFDKIKFFNFGIKSVFRRPVFSGF